MSFSPNELITRLRTHPDEVEFTEVMATINAHYTYTPTRFCNGAGDDLVVNEAGTNEGSCRIFAFARLNQLSAAETLACFGAYYREDVLKHPDATDHANIRTFIRHGWTGIRFDGEALHAV
ncbi:MAG: HopJ type III effector protein [Hahellaceae bacterium]|nr:HopJ type III effector protein [Hahellaceae bacterium]MCP5168361.1 HopJ type III effector protein [Hahellaceae bacterium]